MKKIFTTSIVLMGFIISFSQYTVVAAPSLSSALAELKGQNSQNWGEESKKFKEIISQAKKAYEVYSQVNETLQGFKEMTEFMRTFSQMTSTIQQSSQYYNSVSVLSDDEMKMIEAYYKGVGVEMKGVLSVVEESSNSDNKMTIGERLKGIHLAFNQLQEMMAKTIYFNEKINTYIVNVEQNNLEQEFISNIY